MSSRKVLLTGLPAVGKTTLMRALTKEWSAKGFRVVVNREDPESFVELLPDQRYICVWTQLPSTLHTLPTQAHWYDKVVVLKYDTVGEQVDAMIDMWMREHASGTLKDPRESLRQIARVWIDNGEFNRILEHCIDKIPRKKVVVTTLQDALEDQDLPDPRQERA